jgi:hypothetical protein
MSTKAVTTEPVTLITKELMLIIKGAREKDELLLIEVTQVYEMKEDMSECETNTIIIRCI